MGSQPYSHNISNPWLTSIRPTFNPTRVRSNTRNPLPFSCSKLLRQLSKGPENRWLICNKYNNMKTSFEVSIGSYTRKWPFIIMRGFLLLVFINKISSGGNVLTLASIMTSFIFEKFWMSVFCIPPKVKALQRGHVNPLSLKGDQHQLSPNNIHMLQRWMVMRVNKMITKEKMLWSFIKLSQLILLRNVWRSVWRIYMRILGLKGA